MVKAMKSTETIIDEHRNLIKGELASVAKDIYSDIEKGGGFRYSRQLPINLFEEHFLRFFKGEVTNQEEKDYCYSRWIQVAGHAGTPVDIMSTKGELLFTIPALHDGNLLDPNKAEAIEFALRQAQHHAARSPVASVAYLIKNGKKIAENIQVDNIEEKKRVQWEGFWNYYGIGRSSSKTTIKTDAPTDGTANPEDDFEFV